ncbi:MAG: flagellar hook-basal body complex protein FliE [Rhizobiales bacterium]|nr:flagellar hook-basal body complex protein FliE [Hyphomicrobiales bacterium]
MISSISSLSSVRETTPTPQTAPTAKVAGGDFGSVLSEVAGQAMDTLKSGEAAAIQGIGGGMALQDVVSAIMAAEQTLQTAIAIRDKVVSAYQEISRMAI